MKRFLKLLFNQSLAKRLRTYKRMLKIYEAAILSNSSNYYYKAGMLMGKVKLLGFCNMLIWITNGKGLSDYPELIRIELPESLEYFKGYWYTLDKEGWEMRRRCLVQAIERCEEKLK